MPVHKGEPDPSEYLSFRRVGVLAHHFLARDANVVGEYAHPIHERLLSVNKNLSSPKHFSERL
ncbi:MAG TPA: hypothetical protein VFE47_06950, partial [Tepidisphaeraceae bacterium]|nr:hypothetical protein [Tepidisphaeraceae bacterium]